MNQSDERTNQRLALLRSHVQEWKNHTLQEAQTRNDLISKHQAEKDQRQKLTALEWINYLTLYVERLTNLSIDGQRRWHIMRIRQEQETADLEERISRERN